MIININDLEDYKNFKNLEKEKPLIKINKNDIYPYTNFYRGQSNSIWELEPSISRKNIDEKTTIKKFFDLYGNITLFQNISLIQHKETFTRFLDFTTNIDIALYFACNKNFDMDGKIFCMFGRGMNPYWEKAKIMYYIVNMPIIENDEISVEDYVKYLEINYNNEFTEHGKWLESNIQSVLQEGALAIPTEKDYYKNDRLKRQKGIFFMCPPKYMQKTDANTIDAHKGRFSRTKVCFPKNILDEYIDILIINKAIKKNMLKYLNKNCGINEKYLMPEI